MEITVKKTTYEVEGCKEPCYEITDGYTMVRIAKCYHYIGENTLYLTAFLDGDYQSSDEWTGDFDKLTKSKALELAKRFSIYLTGEVI